MIPISSAGESPSPKPTGSIIRQVAALTVDDHRNHEHGQRERPGMAGDHLRNSAFEAGHGELEVGIAHPGDTEDGDRRHHSDLKTTPSGTFEALVLVASRIRPPNASIIIWIMTDMAIGFSPAAKVRISGTMAIRTITPNASRNNNTALRAETGNFSSSVVAVVCSIRFLHTGSCSLFWYSGSSSSSRPRRIL